MRGGKSFLILIVLAAGIGAYAYFVESKKDVSATPETKRDKVWTIDTSKAEQLEVKAANGDRTTLKKSGAAWQIVSPEPADADQDAVGTILTSLSSLESTKTVDEHPTDAKPYELDPPATTVSVKLTGETAPRQIDLGGKTPSGSDLYARVEGQPKVFLVGASLQDQLNRTTFDLRDKTVLKFDHDKADSLKLEPAGSPAVSLVKKGDEWRLASPADAKADSGAVDAMLNKLAQAKMKAVVAADGSKELKKYGLDKPQATATIGAGSTRASLELGSKSPDGALYAKDATRPIVFTIDAALIDDVKKKPADLRDKMLFEFRSFTALNVDMTHGSETFTAVKQTTPAPASQKNASSVPTETWKLTRPAAKDLDQVKVTDFLVNLANLKADSFVDRPAASGDDYVVTVRYGDAKSPKDERVTFRKSGTTVQAIRQSEPGAAVVPSADFDKITSGLKDLAGGK